VLLTLMVLAAAVVAMVCWGVATRWPVMAGLSFTLTFVLTLFAVSNAALVMSEMQSRGTLVGASPLITVGMPAGCAVLAYATYRISKILTDKWAGGDEQPGGSDGDGTR